jgi:hypothetical protein
LDDLFSVADRLQESTKLEAKSVKHNSLKRKAESLKLV